MSDLIKQTLNKTLEFARENNFRGCLVLSGSQAWCQQSALDCLALHAPSANTQQAICWVGSSAPNSSMIRVIPPHAAQQLLGSDTDYLVIDAWSGLSPDMLGMTSGTLRGGALLLLLTPPFEQWSDYDDPDYLRYKALRPTAYSMHGNFLRRTIKLVKQAAVDDDSAWLKVISEHDCEKSIDLTCSINTCGSQVQLTKKFIASSEQQLVIQAVDDLSRQPEGIILLNADRGRGKSVALGLAVKALLKRDNYRISVVAPLRSQVDNLFSAIGDLSGHKNIGFVAVDQLIANAEALKTMHDSDRASRDDNAICDLLIVDEAAAIPLPVLYQLVDAAPRLVFSSTLHGYEGSGRGFTLRFKDFLLARDQSLQTLTLRQPMRWANGDPLESFFNRWLLLDTENNTVGSNEKPSARINVRRVDSQVLLVNEILLRAVFELLVEAHYQTRPADLRQLLDVPYLHLWIAEESNSGQVVGVLLAFEEGGFVKEAGFVEDNDLLSGIVSGQRRPQGNLLSQSLANQSADANWCRVKSLRVTRIAVAQAYRRQGIASRLIESLEKFALTEGCDYWGSSFGFDSSLLAFWKSHKAFAVYLGLHRDKASGMRNMMVVKPLSKVLEQMSGSLHNYFINDLPYWADRYLPEISSDLITIQSNEKNKRIVDGQNGIYDLYSYDSLRIQRFINAELTYEKIYPSLCRFFAHHPTADYAVTQASLTLAPNWTLLANRFQLKGRRDVIASIKTELIQLTMD
ncbi:GNAT family N-acetyltransferase [Pseudomonadales bacterium]|nr:GNAT family N-acetyltransferase [Pseudomonadales bacterium]